MGDFVRFVRLKKTQGRQTIFRQGPCWNRWLLADMYRSRDLCIEIPPKVTRKKYQRRCLIYPLPLKKNTAIFLPPSLAFLCVSYQQLPFPAAPPAGSGHWFVPDVPHVPPQGQRPRLGEEAWRMISNATFPPPRNSRPYEGTMKPTIVLIRPY